jgi:hypothetical protein
MTKITNEKTATVHGVSRRVNRGRLFWTVLVFSAEALRRFLNSEAFSGSPLFESHLWFFFDVPHFGALAARQLRVRLHFCAGKRACQWRNAAEMMEWNLYGMSFGNFKLIQDIAGSFWHRIIQRHPASCLDRPISEENRLCSNFQR